MPILVTPVKVKPSIPRWVFITLLLILLITLVIVGYLFRLGFTIKSETVENIQSSSLISKQNHQVRVKTVVYKNNYIIPRKITVPNVNIYLTDKNLQKERLLISTIYTVESEGVHKQQTKNVTGGAEIWLYPFSTFTVNYLAQGNWYDYVYQYVDYDELELVTGSTVEKITVHQEKCLGCVNESSGGPDVAVIDFIVNDNKIWREGFIHFIPIIKNIGNQSTGPIQVSYYLNGNFSSSFKLDNLLSGEVINNFIAGSGFQGNFSSVDPSKTEVKVEVKVLTADDVNLKNNEITWKYQYLNYPLPKHTCTYTDDNKGPQDFYSTSSIDYSGTKYTDVCIDSDNLLEYLCDEHPAYKGDAGIEVFLYKCPTGCTAGACVGRFRQ